MKVDTANIYLVTTGKLHPVVVELVTDEGITGIGEAAIAYGLGGTAAAGMIKDLAERMILGRDPSRIEALWSEMYDHSFWAKGGGAIVFAGISAIEQALWDIKGKALGVPVYELLGGKMRDEVRVYANGWYGAARTPAQLAQAAERPLRDGYRALKCYPLAAPDEHGLRHVTRGMVDREFANLAFEKVKAVRAAVGADVEIMLDLSGGLTTAETIRLCRRFEELDIAWIEEPADPFDVGALEKIAERIDIPVAVGERIYTRYGFRKILEPQAADIVQPDVGNTGGIMEVEEDRRDGRGLQHARRAAQLRQLAVDRGVAADLGVHRQFHDAGDLPVLSRAAGLRAGAGGPAGGADQGRLLDVPMRPGSASRSRRSGSSPSCGRRSHRLEVAIELDLDQHRGLRPQAPWRSGRSRRARSLARSAATPSERASPTKSIAGSFSSMPT